YGLSGTVRGLTTCAPTIILAVNVLLGDAIVWWRVWVLWPNSLLVRATCLILLFTTFCAYSLPFLLHISPSRTLIPAASLFDVNDSSRPLGLAASALSLATNVVATALIGIKAWEHRKFVSTATLKRKGRVERVLTLFIESGALYCLLWGFVVAYQVASEQQWKHAPSRYTAVLNGFDYFLKGCLIPLVGIYPTAIIVLVALNKSHFVGSTLEMTAVMTTVVFQNPETTMNSMGYSSM
ncbi:uncharacterized protein BXZ73DRAFT_31763, partial [Epithele typhae]|uniref:uncharacterized protein n=1 Tax=Epithele typhae TaxID=378194 RepID=UPI0020076F3F